MGFGFLQRQEQIGKGDRHEGLRKGNEKNEEGLWTVIYDGGACNRRGPKHHKQVRERGKNADARDSAEVLPIVSRYN